MEDIVHCISRNSQSEKDKFNAIYGLVRDLVLAETAVQPIVDTDVPPAQNELAASVASQSQEPLNLSNLEFNETIKNAGSFPVILQIWRLPHIWEYYNF